MYSSIRFVYKRSLACFLIVLVITQTLSAYAEEDYDYTIDEVRNYFEHSYLPSNFHSDPESIIAILRSVGIYDFWVWYVQQLSFDVTYEKEEFNSEEIPRDDGVILIRIVMPKPLWPYQCYRIYLCYDSLTGHTGYFIIGYDNVFRDICFIGEWTAENEYNDYGERELLLPDDPDYDLALAEEGEYIVALMRALN
ncbi:MAG: hypothetical protein IJJ23_00495 [Clostridia bacterium]|nr:hypothetical protein [Clostridia bacterium]